MSSRTFRYALRQAALISSICLACALLPNSTASAACAAGAQDCLIPVRMARGSDTVTLEGRFAQNADCCAYSLDARAG